MRSRGKLPRRPRGDGSWPGMCTRTPKTSWTCASWNPWLVCDGRANGAARIVEVLPVLAAVVLGGVLDEARRVDPMTLRELREVEQSKAPALHKTAKRAKISGRQTRDGFERRRSVCDAVFDATSVANSTAEEMGATPTESWAPTFGHRQVNLRSPDSALEPDGVLSAVWAMAPDERLASLDVWADVLARGGDAPPDLLRSYLVFLSKGS